MAIYVPEKYVPSVPSTPSTGRAHIIYPVLGRIRAYEEAKSINGIGHKMAKKIIDLALSFCFYGSIKTYLNIMKTVETEDLEQVKD